MKKAEKHYNMLLEKGELDSFMPQATGEWGEDKKSFIPLFEEMEEMVKQYQESMCNINIKEE